MFFSGKSILLERLQDEVEYLRHQNQQLMDRLMVLTNRTAYIETKHQDSLARRETIELEKYRGMTTDQIHEKRDQEKKEDEIVNIQLKQMMTGGDGR